MFQFHDSSDRLNRRAFLQVGSLGLAGLTLPDLLNLRARAAESKSPLKDRSVIFLFMHGGPSQIETFDPKMSAPEGIRSVTGEIPTTVPGVTFGSTFQKLAAQADKFSVVRSYLAGDASHDIKPIVHKDTLNANLGSIYSRVVGMNNPVTGIPTSAALFPKAVDPEAGPEQKNFGNFLSTGLVGSSYAPFAPGGAGNLLQNMQLRIPREKLEDRRQLLQQLDQFRREVDTTGTMQTLDRIQEQAIDVLVRSIAGAFDLSKEDAATIARYDTSKLLAPNAINPKWKNFKHYNDNARTLGKLLLLARRLCEAGCGFVTVTTNFVWDMHADVNNAPVKDGMPFVGGPFDHAVSAFIEDVEARGLSDKIMLVATGEMGRTPRVNKNGGRDHWGNSTPLLLYGAGQSRGRVIGQSSKDGGQPATTPVTRQSLVSTIMHTLFDVGQVRLQRGVPDDVLRIITAGEPIHHLYG